MDNPKIKAQLAVIKRDLKSESKNELVRAVVGFMIAESKANGLNKQLSDEMAKLKEEKKLMEGFVSQNEAAFQTYVDAQPKETYNGTAQAVDNQKVG